MLTSRAPIGYVSIAKKPPATNQGFKSVIVRDGFCAEFRYRLLKHNTDKLTSHGSGTTFRELSGNALKSLSFEFPPLKEQAAIAAILGSMDNKIEIAQEKNKTLESMVQALFTSWFVDFDPLRAKMEGRLKTGIDEEIASLFPNSSENSKTELCLIPSGWTIGTLGDIAINHRRAIEPSAISAETPYIGLEHMPRKNIILANWGMAGTVICSEQELI